MKGRALLFIPVLFVFSYSASAQDATEGLNLSNLTVQGTARSMGFGNTLGSIGADFSALSVNPAGIGVYRTSEITFTPALRINSAGSQYLGASSNDNNVHFNINNFGLVLTNAPKGKRYERRDWKTISFGFGINRVADFNRNYSYQGRNTNSSASQTFEADANQYPSDVSVSGTPGNIGRQSYLLNYDNISGRYTSVVPFSGGINQVKSVKQTGRINEYAFSFGGNYREKLMLGITVGVADVQYAINSDFSEMIAANNTAPNPDKFISFDYNQNYSLTGTGINLKLGAIYKVTNFLRIGGALHTPTAYSLSNSYTPYINANVNGSMHVLSVDNGALPQNVFDYQFASPWRGVLSAAFVLKGLGFITADYEYVGYGSMRYIYPAGVDNAGYSYSVYEDAINRELRNTYSGTSNFRIGAEGLITKYFMGRVGFGYYGSPYRISNYSDGRIDVSLGLGFRFRHFFTDIAWVRSMYHEQQVPYNIDFSQVFSGPAVTLPVATTDFASNNVAWTIGFKF